MPTYTLLAACPPVRSSLMDEATVEDNLDAVSHAMRSECRASQCRISLKMQNRPGSLKGSIADSHHNDTLRIAHGIYLSTGILCFFMAFHEVAPPPHHCMQQVRLSKSGPDLQKTCGPADCPMISMPLLTWNRFLTLLTASPSALGNR